MFPSAEKGRPDVFMWLSRRFSKRLQWITRGESRRYHFQNTSNWNDFFMNMCRELNFFKNSNLLQGKSAVGYRQNIFNFCDCIAITFVIIFVAMWCVGIYHYYIQYFIINLRWNSPKVLLPYEYSPRGQVIPELAPDSDHLLHCLSSISIRSIIVSGYLLIHSFIPLLMLFIDVTFSDANSKHLNIYNYWWWCSC